MKAYCITLAGNAYSEAVAQRCKNSARTFGVDVQTWDAVSPERAKEVMAANGLRWTWANGNKSSAVCPVTGLKQHPYQTKDVRMRIGCAMSHYDLWCHCVAIEEPILILEHDAVFQSGLPRFACAYSAVMINSPVAATPRGAWWATQIANKGVGIHDKTIVFEDALMRPDGLAGNSAYIITPAGALRAIHAYNTLGVWPNDATLCRQIVPGLGETYPFVTVVRARKTMAEGY